MNLNGQLMVFCISRLNASVVAILMSIVCRQIELDLTSWQSFIYKNLIRRYRKCAISTPTAMLKKTP